MIKNQWYGILPSKAVRKHRIVAVKRLNLDLAIFRTESGELGCVVDQCSHRGAALSLGQVKDSCLQCPFHGLEFDTQGRCTVIPANGRASTEDISRFNVVSYPIREAHGIIYVWYGENGQQTDTLPFFPEIDQSFVYSELADQWHAHYSRAIENQLDVVHLPFVHATTIGRGNRTLVHGPKAVFENETLITSPDNEVDVGQPQKPASACEIGDLQLNFKFPNLWMNRISDNLKVVIYFAPVDDENTILYIRFYHNFTPFKPLNQLIALFGKYGNLKIERQDKRVVVTQQPKASSLRSAEKLLPGDGPIILYRKIREELKNK